MRVFEVIANSHSAMLNCMKNNNAIWEDKHRDMIFKMLREYMPSGSGFDAGTQFDFEASNENKLVFNTSFHHMDQNGFYKGWTKHKVIIKPSFIGGYDMRVTGRNYNGIKDYIAETFEHALQQTIIQE